MPLPAWLRRWAAGVLEFIEAEAKALPALMISKWRARKGRGGSSDVVDLAGEDEDEEADGEQSGRDEEQVAQAAAAAVGGSVTPAAQEAAEVAAEVEHQRKSRVQALAIALDKAKLLLRHQAREGTVGGGPFNCPAVHAAVCAALLPWCWYSGGSRAPLASLLSPSLAHSLAEALAVMQEEGGSRSPPLRMLSEREAVGFLWTDDDSVARRCACPRLCCPPGVPLLVF